MFDILSTAELTISAAIVVGFLSLTMAVTTRGRLAVLLALGAWFGLVLADRRDRRAQSRAWRRARARPHRRFARGGAHRRLFRSPFRAKRDGPNPFARACRPPCDPPPGVHVSCSLRQRPPSCAIRAERGRGRYVHRRDRPAGRLGGGAIRRPRAARCLAMERARGRGPRHRSYPRALVGARPAAGFRWTSRRFGNDPFALARHSRLPGPDPAVHARSYLFTAVREDRSPAAGACVARRRPAEIGLKRKTPGREAPASKVVLAARRAENLVRRVRNGGALSSQPARRRPPSGVRTDLTPWGTGPPRNERRRRSESASSPPSSPGSLRSRSQTSRPEASTPACPRRRG